MEILNVRLGLATNSSSTHSIIFLPRGLQAAPIAPAGGPGRYGWDSFQLVDRESKMDYLATLLHYQISREIGRDVADAVARDWCGRLVDPDGYVDHQSRITLPREWNGPGVDREFFEELREFLRRDDVAIVGGNDNYDDGRPEILREPGVVAFPDLPSDDGNAPWVARRDAASGYWTIFNRDTGAKIRVTFRGSDPALSSTRSSAPELVDVKVTDHCPYGCAYCYQDSTHEGQHASAGWLAALSRRLGEMRVLEVALGGGEPTLHPHFEDILRNFRLAGVVPNFTTRNLAWLRDDQRRARILDLAGAFAYSAETADSVRGLSALLKEVGIQVDQGHGIRGGRRVTIQHVVGVVDEPQFRDVLAACADASLPVTLLGYKQVGRGSQFGVRPSDRWLEILAQAYRRGDLRVGIDTALADRHWDALLAAGVPRRCMTRVEGQHSCYVDAVARTISASSYVGCPGIPIPDDADLRILYRDLPR